jgi:hypothetical protein
MEQTRKKLGRKELVEYAHEQLSFWAALRKLGFAADDIFAAFYNGGELFTTLRTQGKEWHVSVSRGTKVHEDDYIPIYTAECDRWNAAAEAERRQIFDVHMPVEKTIQVAISVRAKGFDIPAFPNAPSPGDVAELQGFLESRLAAMNAHDDDVQGMPN